MDLKKLPSDQLKDHFDNVKNEIKSREDGKHMPVYVINSGDTNSCFKDKTEAINKMCSFRFEHGECKDDWEDTMRCYTRWVSSVDYEQYQDGWIEV